MKYFTRLFWIQSFVLICVALFHGSAEYFSWYYMYPRLDVLMHFLGGAWVSLISYWAIHDVLGFTPRTWVMYFFLITTTIFVGLIWEFFELIIHVISIIEIDMRDSIKDLFMDILGASVVCFLIKRQIL